jgi:hypothetical protein
MENLRVSKGRNRPKRPKRRSNNKLPAMTANNSGTVQGQQVVPPPEPYITLKKNENLQHNDESENVVDEELSFLGKFGLKVLAHLAAVLILVGIGIGADHIFKDYWGDPTLVEIPVRYYVQLGDAATILTLVGLFVRDIIRLKK